MPAVIAENFEEGAPISTGGDKFGLLATFSTVS